MKNVTRGSTWHDKSTAGRKHYMGRKRHGELRRERKTKWGVG